MSKLSMMALKALILNHTKPVDVGGGGDNNSLVVNSPTIGTGSIVNNTYTLNVEFDTGMKDPDGKPIYRMTYKSSNTLTNLQTKTTILDSTFGINKLFVGIDYTYSYLIRYDDAIIPIIYFASSGSFSYIYAGSTNANKSLSNVFNGVNGLYTICLTVFYIYK